MPKTPQGCDWQRWWFLEHRVTATVGFQVGRFMEFSGTAPVPLFDAASVFRTSEVHTPEKAIYMLILPGSELGLYGSSKKNRMDK